MRRPLIATMLVQALPKTKAGTYDAQLQLTVNRFGEPLLDVAGKLRMQTRTFVERDPADPAEPKPPKPQTFTRVVQEPADISGFSSGTPQPPRTITKVINEPADVARGLPLRRNPKLATPWSDNLATGAVDF